MSIRPDWADWEPWAKLWSEWVRLRKGEKNIAMEHIQFIDLYNFFVRQVKALGVDPHTIDVKAFIDPKLTYNENKAILAEVLAVPPTEKEYASMYESFRHELEEQVKQKYPDVWATWEKQLADLEREVEALPKVERERAKFKKLSEELAYKLEETVSRFEEEKKALEKRVAPVKLRILRAFREGIIDYTPGSVVETRDIDWALSLVQKGLAERVAVEVPVEVKPPPPPPTAPPEEIFRPPKKPPEVPVKVLPPIPEVCPRDGSPLKEVTRVPMLIKDPLRLEPEEEYWRARMGMPLPTAVVEWIEVPATMRVWMCEQDHYFERDARGRLVELTPEFLYRKILRETAKVRRISVPAVPAWEEWEAGRVRIEEEWVGPHVLRLEEWAREIKHMTMEEFDAKPVEEIRKLVKEYRDFISRE